MAIGIIVVEISLAFGFWSAQLDGTSEVVSWALGESSNVISVETNGRIEAFWVPLGPLGGVTNHPPN